MTLIEKIARAIDAIEGPMGFSYEDLCREAAKVALDTIVTELSAGDGVTDVDREAAFNTGIRLTKREWIEVYEAFAQHRALAIAAERARRDAEIVAWLRDLAHESQRKAAAPIADAIERGEV